MRMKSNYGGLSGNEVTVSIDRLEVRTHPVSEQVKYQKRGTLLVLANYFGVFTKKEGKEHMCPAEAGGTGGVFRGETGGGT